MSLPTDSQARKDIPIDSGCYSYFPDALAEVARLSKVSNDKHNPGQPMHWSREKSSDHADCIARHQQQRGTLDEPEIPGTEPFLHDIKVAWRALAQAQIAIEKQRRACQTEYASELRRQVIGVTSFDAAYWMVERRLRERRRDVTCDKYINGARRSLGNRRRPPVLYGDPGQLAKVNSTPWYPDNSGKWVEYAGGGCPVPPDVRVSWLGRSERSSKTYVALTLPAHCVDWRSSGVVAYKVVG